MVASSTGKRARTGKIRKFYGMGPNPCIGGKGGWIVENEPVLLMGRFVLGPPPGQRGFPQFPELPRLVFDKKLGRPPRDVEQFHDYWLVSDRMKAILQRIDPDGVAFVQCLSRTSSGSAAPVYWLCDVLRILDAVDEEKSHLRIETDSTGYKWYSLTGRPSLVFREEIVGSAHIFRLRFSIGNVICDQALKSACKAAGMTGIAFDDAARF